MKNYLLLLLFVFGTSATQGQVFWQQVATGFTTASRGTSFISFANENVVWTDAYDGATPTNVIREWGRSIDGGNTWTNGVINLGASSTSLGIGSIEAIDANTAFVAAYPSAAGVTGGIWKTIDGGATWTRQNTATFTGTDAFANFVTFWDANEGICQGDPNGGYFEIYRTMDGGTTWTRVPSGNIPAPLTGEYGYVGNYDVNGDSIWFGTNKGRIYRSNDKGLTWSVSQSPITDFGSAASNGEFAFESATTGILQNNSYEFWLTNDAGATWTSIAASGAIRENAICSVPGVPGAYVILGEDVDFGERGSSYTLDYGLNWTTIDELGDDVNVNNPTDVKFYNSTVGLASGFTTSSVVGGIFKYVGDVFTLSNDSFDNAAKVVATPNPTSGLLNLAGQNINQVIVTDILGKVVSTNNFNALNNVSIDLSSFNSGVYFVKVSNDANSSSTIKVVKQ